MLGQEDNRLGKKLSKLLSNRQRTSLQPFSGSTFTTLTIFASNMSLYIFFKRLNSGNVRVFTPSYLRYNDPLKNIIINFQKCINIKKKYVAKKTCFLTKQPIA